MSVVPIKMRIAVVSSAAIVAASRPAWLARGVPQSECSAAGGERGSQEQLPARRGYQMAFDDDAVADLRHDVIRLEKSGWPQARFDKAISGPNENVSSIAIAHATLRKHFFDGPLYACLCLRAEPIGQSNDHDQNFKDARNHRDSHKRPPCWPACWRGMKYFQTFDFIVSILRNCMA
jgi:hypothetical protein